MSRRSVALPLAFILALAAIGGLPAVRDNARLVASIWGAAGILALWHAWLLAGARRNGRRLAVTRDLRPQHYVQACAQGTVLLYWGWYWPGVYGAAYLLTAQILFAYAFDLLLSWSRRNTHTLGFGPLPVILSINLFLWFKADWFSLQFLLIAVGLAVKELVRWEKDGRRVHVFNPSSFPLALFSLALIATGTTELTWGQQIATTLNDAPQIYLVIFLVSVPGQLLFGVATMTLSAVVTTYLFGLLYLALTGTYYFVDSYIPIAVFLGMHLLVTDPSTSPRRGLGRILFGVLYALSVITLYTVLERFGAPTFYDKLLAVPLLNLGIKHIDRVADGWTNWWGPVAAVRFVAGRRRAVASVGIWTIVFVALSVAQGVGETHRGQWVTFWLSACDDDRPNGCRHAARLTSAYCRNGSGWACNEYGVLLQPALRPARAGRAFQRACDLGFAAGCDNLDPALADHPRRAPPTDADYRIVVRGRKGRRPELALSEMRQRACAQGFVESCQGP